MSNEPDVTETERTAATAEARDGARRRLVRREDVRPTIVRFIRGNGILLAFIVLIVVGALRSEHFLTAENFANVARQASIAGIVGIGMTFVILTAGIDLSVGSILGIVAIIYASILAGGVPWPLAILLALVLGAFVGSLNGSGSRRADSSRSS